MGIWLCFHKGPSFIRPRLGFLLHQIELWQWGHLFWNYSNHPNPALTHPHPSILAFSLVNSGSRKGDAGSREHVKPAGPPVGRSRIPPWTIRSITYRSFPFQHSGTLRHTKSTQTHQQTERISTSLPQFQHSLKKKTTKKHNLPWRLRSS